MCNAILIISAFTVSLVERLDPSLSLTPHLIGLFGFRLYIPLNSYDHDKTVSSPYDTFFQGKLD